MTASSSRRTPKLVSAEPKKVGVTLAAEEQLLVVVGADAVEQRELLARPALHAGPPPRPRAIGSTTSSGASVAPAGDAGEAHEVARCAGR